MAAEDAEVVAHGPELAGDRARGAGSRTSGFVRGNSAGKRRKTESPHVTTGRRLAATQLAADVAAGAAQLLPMRCGPNFNVPLLLVGVVMSVLSNFFKSGEGYVNVRLFYTLMATELQSVELADDEGDRVEAVCEELRDRGYVRLHDDDELSYDYYFSEGNCVFEF